MSRKARCHRLDGSILQKPMSPAGQAKLVSMPTTIFKIRARVHHLPQVDAMAQPQIITAKSYSNSTTNTHIPSIYLMNESLGAFTGPVPSQGLHSTYYYPFSTLFFRILSRTCIAMDNPGYRCRAQSSYLRGMPRSTSRAAGVIFVQKLRSRALRAIPRRA